MLPSSSLMFQSPVPISLLTLLYASNGEPVWRWCGNRSDLIHVGKVTLAVVCQGEEWVRGRDHRAGSDDSDERW